MGGNLVLAGAPTNRQSQQAPQAPPRVRVSAALRGQLFRPCLRPGRNIGSASPMCEVPHNPDIASHTSSRCAQWDKSPRATKKLPTQSIGWRSSTTSQTSRRQKSSRRTWCVLGTHHNRPPLAATRGRNAHLPPLAHPVASHGTGRSHPRLQSRCLLEALESKLGAETFDGELKEAWASAFDSVAEAAIAAAPKEVRPREPLIAPRRARDGSCSAPA